MNQETKKTSIWFMVVMTVLAIAVRISVRTFVADDWTIFWEDWFFHLKEGGFHSLAEGWYDYAPPIVYLLYIISVLPINEMTGYKGICCILEIVTALLIYRTVKDHTKSQKRAALAYCLYLFMPTVITNSAVWAQCDVIYTSMVLAAAYFLMKDRPWIGMFFYGAAFATKLQTLFVFPAIVMLWVYKKLELKHFITLPVMYLIGIFPAFLAGRPFIELLGIYANQGTEDRWSLSLYFPNIYQIIGNNFFLDEYVSAGMLLILGILMIAMFCMAYRRVAVKPEFIVMQIAFWGILTTYFIPHMHERYLYLTDVFLLIYGVMRPKRFLYFVASSFISIVGYSHYLTKQLHIPYGVLAIMQLALLIRLGLDVYAYLHDEDNQKAFDPAVKAGFDSWLRGLLYREFSAFGIRFDFLEALLTVCISGVGVLLRTCFAYGLPDPVLMAAEWMIAFLGSALVWKWTKDRHRTLAVYGILWIMPVMVADGAILRSNAGIGALLFMSAWYLVDYDKKISDSMESWIAAALLAALLLYSVKYVGLLFAAAVLWRGKRLQDLQMAMIAIAGTLRMGLAYRAWLTAGYSLTTFHWPNIYGFTGMEAVTTQLIDPIALVGLTLAIGILFMLTFILCQGSFDKDPKTDLRVSIFFLLTAVYFLPYMDQSAGYLPCVLSVLYLMVSPEDFLCPMILQFVAFVGYQHCLNGESMMPMVLFSLMQFGVIVYLGWNLAIAGKVPGYQELCVKRDGK